ncbi:MAG: DUF4919 domain-containing protein [Proteobacteria bacterium]|nr:MAG: DUF4919 domain-containing protein [Pseudomonadota bacterium]
MNIYKIILLSLTLVGCSSTQEYETRSYNWSENPNYSELRKTIGWSDDYNSVCMMGRPLSEMNDAMNKEEWNKAIAVGDAWLNQCPIDIRVHYYMMISMERIGNESGAQDHFRWLSGLMDDLVASGDGKTPETAFEVISIAEEYDVLFVLGLKKKSQALISGPVLCDLITATDENGKEISIYFNPAAHFERLNQMLK